MGYDNRFTGEIAIVPPLTWAEIRNGPGVSDVRVRVVEETVDTETGQNKVLTGDAIVPLDIGTYSGHSIVKDIQAIVDFYGKRHEFVGHIQVQWDSGFDDPIPQRYVVVNNRVEMVTPRLVWPGEDDPAARFTITWDHDFVMLWCEDCPDDERPMDVFPGNPTGIAEIQAAMRKHRAERHEET